MYSVSYTFIPVSRIAPPRALAEFNPSSNELKIKALDLPGLDLCCLILQKYKFYSL